MKKIIISILSVVLAIVGGISFLSSIIFRIAFLYPRQNKRIMLRRMIRLYGEDYLKHEELVAEMIELESHDGHILKAYYHGPSEPSNKVIILHHGYLANRYMSYQFYNLFMEENYHILIVDMRSHGESEGKYATYGYEEQKDLGLWVDYMREKIGEDVIIGLHGHSMGAATVLLYGGNNEEKVDFIVANSGYSTATDQLKNQFQKVRLPEKLFYPLVNRKLKKKCGFELEEVSPIDAIKDATVPTMFVHGTNDILVDHGMSRQMFEQKKGGHNKLLFIEGAGHIEAMSIDPQKYVDEVRGFMKEALANR